MWISSWRRAHVFDSASRGSLYPPHECQHLSFLLTVPPFFQGVKCQFVGLEASAHLYTAMLKSRCNHVEEFPVFKLCFEMFKRKQRAELHWERKFSELGNCQAIEAEQLFYLTKSLLLTMSSEGI